MALGAVVLSLFQQTSSVQLWHQLGQDSSPGSQKTQKKAENVQNFLGKISLENLSCVTGRLEALFSQLASSSGTIYTLTSAIASAGGYSVRNRQVLCVAKQRK